MKIASSGIVSVWVRSIPQSESQIQEILEERLGTGLPLKKDLKNFGYSHSYIKLHCKDRKMRVVQEKIFNKDGFLLSSYFVPPHWKNLHQDFFPSKLSSIVCPKKYAKR